MISRFSNIYNYTLYNLGRKVKKKERLAGWKYTSGGSSRSFCVFVKFLIYG